MRRSLKVILQHDERDCGAACFAMISGYYGHKLPISRCRELTKTDRIGTNVYGIIDGAAQIGLKAEALQGDPGELEESIRNGEVSFPFIAHIVSDAGMFHYIVVYGFRNGKYLVADPGVGKHRMSQEEFNDRWTGYVITFEPSDSFRKINETKGSFTKFLWLLKGQYRKLTAAFIFSLVIAGIGIAGSFIFQLLIDGTVQISEHLGLLFEGLILLYVLQAVIQYIRGYLISKVSRTIDVRLTLSYYNHIMDLPMSSLYVRQTGEYLSRFSDAANIQSAVSTAAITLFLDAVMVIACGIILCRENAVMFCVSLLVVAIYAVIVLCYRKPMERNNRKVMENGGILESYFKETIDGAETIKAAEAGTEVKKRTKEKYDRLSASLFKSGLVSLSQDTLSEAVELIGTAVILWIGFSLVFHGSLTLGELITFNALLAYFMAPIKNLIEFQPTVQTALVAADRLNDVLELAPESTGSIGSSHNELPEVQKWEMSHIDFRYGNRELVLKDVNMTIPKGRKIAIAGESGSGKTTLAKLLLRFYEPEKGTIVVNGESIEKFDIDSVRKNIAYVSQNTFLFSDTIRNNLKLGNPDVTDEEIGEACRISHADEFVKKMPLGLDTPLDENGANLSGGQRQRLSIARALLKKPQLLILDEATSNLDTITESAIKNAIFEENKDLTCLIIAHRLSTIRECDEICVMEDGRIVEKGTHEELMSKLGVYAKLWKMQ